jgi:hypothetical protein
MKRKKTHFLLSKIMQEILVDHPLNNISGEESSKYLDKHYNTFEASVATSDRSPRVKVT